MITKHLLIWGLFSAFSALQGIVPLYAQDYGSAGSTAAGAVNWHMRQQLFWQNNAPYMFRPITEEDLRPGPPADEPSVLFSGQEVQGKIIPKVPSADEIHFK